MSSAWPQNWDVERLAAEVKALGVPAVDYHVGYLGDSGTVTERIRRGGSRRGRAWRKALPP